MSDSDLIVSYQKISDAILEKGLTEPLLTKLRELRFQNEAYINVLAETSDSFKRLRTNYEKRLESLCALRGLITQLELKPKENKIEIPS